MSDDVPASGDFAKESPLQNDVRPAFYEKQALLQLHTAEYSALTTRATYLITLATSIFPLMGIYLALMAQLCKPEGIAMRVAYQYLLRLPIQRSLMFWGNLFVLSTMLRLWSQFLVEQYKIVLYIEGDLRAMVQDSVASPLFWGYEAALRKGRGGAVSIWWEYSVSCGVGITIVILCTALWPLTRWDVLGSAVDTGVWVSLILSAREAQTTRKAWEQSLLDNSARSTVAQVPSTKSTPSM